MNKEKTKSGRGRIWKPSVNVVITVYVTCVFVIPMITGYVVLFQTGSKPLSDGVALLSMFIVVIVMILYWRFENKTN